MIMSEDDIDREESAINRIMWSGGMSVTLVTILVLALVMATATSTWEYVLFPVLAGVPLVYGVASNFVTRRMQSALLDRYQSQLKLRVSELEEMALRDELTGLHNRRHFHQVLNAEVEKAQSCKEPLALILMDLDKLKRINDEYGHGVGDVVIANLGRVIAKHIRGSDVAARIGGDEFGVVMPSTDKRGAFTLARRLLDELDRTPMYEEGETRVMITISIGVSGFPWGGESVEELIHWADSDMYANKISRRLPNAPVAVDAGNDIESLPEDFLMGI